MIILKKCISISGLVVGDVIFFFLELNELFLKDKYVSILYIS